METSYAEIETVRCCPRPAYLEIFRKYNKLSFSWLVVGWRKTYFVLPFKRFENITLLQAWLEKGWTLSKSIRVKFDPRTSSVRIDFILEKVPPPKRTKGIILGGDQGYVDLLRTSDGQVIGESFKTLIETFVKRQKHTYLQASKTAGIPCLKSTQCEHC